MFAKKKKKKLFSDINRFLYFEFQDDFEGPGSEIRRSLKVMFLNKCEFFMHRKLIYFFSEAILVIEL